MQTEEEEKINVKGEHKILFYKNKQDKEKDEKINKPTELKEKQ